jgi:hypothetical protein
MIMLTPTSVPIAQTELDGQWIPIDKKQGCQHQRQRCHSQKRMQQQISAETDVSHTHQQFPDQAARAVGVKCYH